MTHDSTSHPDSFGSRTTLPVGDRRFEIFALGAAGLVAGHDVGRLPYCVKVLLENLLRHEDGVRVSADDVAAVADWGVRPAAHGAGAGDDAKEIAFTPERVLMQDFTGVPAVVDLAAMRDALVTLGGDPGRINPLVPVELVIDHSVIAERSGVAAPSRTTSRSSTSATSSATSCSAGPKGPSTGSGSSRRGPGSAIR